MYTPRYGMNYITQQAAVARLGAMNRAKSHDGAGAGEAAPSHPYDEEAGVLWRMLSVVAVVAIIAVGFVLAVAVGGLQS